MMKKILFIFLLTNQFFIINKADIAADIKKKVQEMVQEKIKKLFKNASNDLENQIPKIEKAGNNIKPPINKLVKTIKEDLEPVQEIKAKIQEMIEETKAIIPTVKDPPKDIITGLMIGKFKKLMNLNIELHLIINEKVTLKNSLLSISNVITAIKSFIQALLHLEWYVFNRNHNKNAMRWKYSFFPGGFFPKLKDIVSVLDKIIQNLNNLSKAKMQKFLKTEWLIMKFILKNYEKILKNPNAFIKNLMMKEVCNIKLALSNLNREINLLQKGAKAFKKKALQINDCIQDNVAKELERHTAKTLAGLIGGKWEDVVFSDKTKKILEGLIGGEWFVDVVCDKTKMCFRYPRIYLGKIMNNVGSSISFIKDSISATSQIISNTKKFGVTLFENSEKTETEIASLASNIGELSKEFNLIGKGLIKNKKIKI